MKFIFLIIFCLPISAMAQQKSNNNDLRVKKEIFTIVEVSKGKHLSYRLETSVTGQYNIRMFDSEKTINNLKVDTSDAQAMDDEFVDSFISFKYIMEEKKSKKCKETFKLSLRGESLNICSNEKNKIKIINVFIDKLKKQFS